MPDYRIQAEKTAIVFARIEADTLAEAAVRAATLEKSEWKDTPYPVKIEVASIELSTFTSPDL